MIHVSLQGYKVQKITTILFHRFKICMLHEKFVNCYEEQKYFDAFIKHLLLPVEVSHVIMIRICSSANKLFQSIMAGINCMSGSLFAPNTYVEAPMPKCDRSRR